jgi:hypothetical protein
MRCGQGYLQDKHTPRGTSEYDRMAYDLPPGGIDPEADYEVRSPDGKVWYIVGASLLGFPEPEVEAIARRKHGQPFQPLAVIHGRRVEVAS